MPYLCGLLHQNTALEVIRILLIVDTVVEVEKEVEKKMKKETRAAQSAKNKENCEEERCAKHRKAAVPPPNDGFIMMYQQESPAAPPLPLDPQVPESSAAPSGRIRGWKACTKFTST